jgi:hypothetical protein
MSNRPLLMLAGVAVLLGVAYFMSSQSEKASLSPHSATNFVGLDSGLVNRITVSRLGTVVEFQRSGDGWIVIDNDIPRRTERGVVDNIANIAHNLSVGEIISSNPEKQMLFEIDTLIGRSLRFYRDTQELATLIVGKSGTDYRSTYVRKPNAKDVFLATTPLTRLLERPVNGYRDRTILSLDTAQLASIQIQAADLNYQLLRVDSLWQLNDSKGSSAPANTGKVTSMITQLANLRISDFVPAGEAQNVDFDEKTDRINIGMRDGSTVQLMLKLKDETSKNYYLRTSNDSELYSIYEHVRNSVIKKPEELL